MYPQSNVLIIRCKSLQMNMFSFCFCSNAFRLKLHGIRDQCHSPKNYGKIFQGILHEIQPSLIDIKSWIKLSSSNSNNKQAFSHHMGQAMEPDLKLSMPHQRIEQCFLIGYQPNVNPHVNCAKDPGICQLEGREATPKEKKGDWEDKTKLIIN